MLRRLFCCALMIACIGRMPAAASGTFGKVVPIGGAAADIALDEPRGYLYIANFTANRIEQMSLANHTIQTSINVSSQPASLALSPDGRHLIVAHYGNFAAPASAANALTVIDLETNGRQTFVLGNPPLGVAFGSDGRALVVTTQEFMLFDPVLGTTRILDTISGLTSKTLPVSEAGPSFPPNIVAASIGVSGDGLKMYG
jgi:DNA-binding beta-propeller fold protein YncE